MQHNDRFGKPVKYIIIRLLLVTFSHGQEYDVDEKERSLNSVTVITTPITVTTTVSLPP